MTILNAQDLHKSPYPPNLGNVESDFPRVGSEGAKIGFNCVIPDAIKIQRYETCTTETL